MLNVELRLSLSYDYIQLGLCGAFGGLWLRGTPRLWHTEEVHAGGDVSEQKRSSTVNVSGGSAEKNDHIKQRSGGMR